MLTGLKIKDLQDQARPQRVAIRSQCVPTNTRKACFDNRGKSEIARFQGARPRRLRQRLFGVLWVVAGAGFNR
jgi:hypothetical protein